MEQARIIIVDDNEDSLDIMQYFIEQLPDFFIVDKCKNGEELVDSIMKTDPDVILLDINMPKLNGMEAMRSCLRIKSDLIFIFITSYDEYAVQAFELSALDYLVKPIEKTRLYTALEKVKKVRKQVTVQEKAATNHTQRLFIKDNNNYFYIPQHDIIFIEKIGKKCHIYTPQKTYTTSEAIGDLMRQLPEDTFFMSHRSYILNLTKISQIKAINQTYLAFFLNTDKYAHVSKLKIEELQHKIKQMH